MRILKRAEQKNFEVEERMYTKNQLERFHQDDLVFQLRDIKYFEDSDDETYRVDSESVAKLDIILDEDGFYRTVAVLKTGERIYISL